MIDAHHPPRFTYVVSANTDMKALRAPPWLSFPTVPTPSDLLAIAPQSMFSGSSGAKIGGGTFVSAAESANVKVTHIHDTRSGFDMLLRASLKEAMRDSSAREIPRCFEGTRTEHRNSITSWGKGGWKSQNARVMWMDGPAGVGKSAIAQTWADELAREDNKLAAAFFFSRPNGWNQPIRLIPTIAYQLATKYPSYRAIVDAAVARDPLMLEKSIDTQFEELLVKPIHQLSSEDHLAIENTIIVVDGLDECGPLKTNADSTEVQTDSFQAQVAIINVITSSAIAEASPFLWGIFSRPESHITTAFSSQQATKVTWHLTLPLKAPNADKDMEAYLRDAFVTIRLKYPSIPSSWPSEDSLHQLVKQSDGLFAYGTSAIRYIERGVSVAANSRLGPEERLHLLLERGHGSRAKLSKLNQLYLLVMDQIPKGVLPNTLLILYANYYYTNAWAPSLRNPRKTIPVLSSLLAFSQPAFHDAAAPLYCVLQVTAVDGTSHPSLGFYHASFTDFVTTPERSTAEYCIMTSQVCSHFYSACVDALCRPLVLSSLSMRYDSCLEDFNSAEEQEIAVRQAAMGTLLNLEDTVPYLHIYEYPDVLERLARLDWNTQAEAYSISLLGSQIRSFAKQIPIQWRFRIIQPKNIVCKVVWAISGFPFGWNYVLGHGKKKALLTHPREGERFKLIPYFKK